MYTSVVSVLGITELTRAAKILSNRELSAAIEIFGFVGVVYFAFCWGIGQIGTYLEGKWSWAPRFIWINDSEEVLRAIHMSDGDLRLDIILHMVVRPPQWAA